MAVDMDDVSDTTLCWCVWCFADTLFIDMSDIYAWHDVVDVDVYDVMIGRCFFNMIPCLAPPIPSLSIIAHLGVFLLQNVISIHSWCFWHPYETLFTQLAATKRSPLYVWTKQYKTITSSFEKYHKNHSCDIISYLTCFLVPINRDASYITFSKKYHLRTINDMWCDVYVVCYVVALYTQRIHPLYCPADKFGEFMSHHISSLLAVYVEHWTLFGWHVE